MIHARFVPTPQTGTINRDTDDRRNKHINDLIPWYLVLCKYNGEHHQKLTLNA